MNSHVKPPQLMTPSAPRGAEASSENKSPPVDRVPATQASFVVAARLRFQVRRHGKERAWIPLRAALLARLPNAVCVRSRKKTGGAGHHAVPWVDRIRVHPEAGQGEETLSDLG